MRLWRALPFVVTAFVILIAADAAIGRGWTLLPSPPLNGASARLAGVSCPSLDACGAVGASSAGQPPYASRWDGLRWHAQTLGYGGLVDPYPPDLNSVSCPSRALCVAVGDQERSIGRGGYNFVPLVEQWDGVRWSSQTFPRLPDRPFSALLGVSCPSVRNCVAVGYSGEGALVAHWNLDCWTIQPTH